MASGLAAAGRPAHPFVSLSNFLFEGESWECSQWTLVPGCDSAVLRLLMAEPWVLLGCQPSRAVGLELRCQPRVD